MNAHVREASFAKTKTHKLNWIKSLLCDGIKPEISMLQETNRDEWREDEMWNIAYFKSIGCKLTNGTLGGDGVVATLETREKIANGLRGRKASKESKEKMRLAKLGTKQTKETVLKRIISLTGKKHSNPRTEEQRKTISLSHLGQIPWNKGIKMSEKARKNMSIAKTGIKHTEEHIKNRTKYSEKRFKKLTPASVFKIKEAVDVLGLSLNKVASIFGVSKKTVLNIKNNKYSIQKEVA